MDYEKKYNHALGVVRKLQKDWASTQNRAAREIELAFPELRESEDERVRKRLINLIRELAENKVPIMTGGYFVDGQDKKYIAWLEKQKDAIGAARQQGYEEGMEDGVSMVENAQKEQKSVEPNDICVRKMVDTYRNTEEYDEAGNRKGTPVNCMVRAYEQGIRDVLKVVKQKPAKWNDEDKTNLKFCIYSLHQYGYTTYADFLKHLPERFNLQSKQEWSEEDARCLRFIRSNIEYLKREDKAYRDSEDQAELQRELDFISKVLKRLAPPQLLWKPSEEQIHAIVEALKYLPNNKDEWMVLNTLADVLRKLM